MYRNITTLRKKTSSHLPAAWFQIFLKDVSEHVIFHHFYAIHQKFYDSIICIALKHLYWHKRVEYIVLCYWFQLDWQKELWSSGRELTVKRLIYMSKVKPVKEANNKIIISPFWRNTDLKYVLYIADDCSLLHLRISKRLCRCLCNVVFYFFFGPYSFILSFGY